MTINFEINKRIDKNLIKRLLKLIICIISLKRLKKVQAYFLKRKQSSVNFKLTPGQQGLATNKWDGIDWPLMRYLA